MKLDDKEKGGGAEMKTREGERPGEKKIRVKTKRRNKREGKEKAWQDYRAPRLGEGSPRYGEV